MAIRLEDVNIRPLRESDNPGLAKVIRDTLAEFGANHPGTVYFDPTTDQLYTLFQRSGSFYQVAEYQGEIIGGGGIFPSDGLPEDTCELVKMYIRPLGRGMGLGGRLITDCIRAAKEKGYRRIYLETMPELKQALNVYAHYGFSYLDKAMGNTGHFGCQLWMIKEL